MLLPKKLYTIFLTLLFSFFISGCIHQLDKKGLTLSISQSQLNDSFENSFPIKKDFIFGSITVNQPKIDILENSNRINVHINLDFLALSTEAQYGNFSISGEPHFNKEKSSIYLKNITIDRCKFKKLRLEKELNKIFLSFLDPMVNKLFENFPIYKIPKNSIQGSFVQDIKIEDSKLLITYGI